MRKKKSAEGSLRSYESDGFWAVEVHAQVSANFTHSRSERDFLPQTELNAVDRATIVIAASIVGGVL